MKLKELLPLVFQWRSADSDRKYVGIQRGRTILWYYDRTAIPEEVQELEITQVEVCTGGRVVYHLLG